MLFLDVSIRHPDGDFRSPLRRLQQELKITTSYVTHDQTEAMNRSDRSVVMNTGRIEQIGSAEGIYNDPWTRFVADFLGQINLLNAEITDSDIGLETQVVVATRPQDAPNEIGANLHIGWQAEDSRVLTE